MNNYRFHWINGGHVDGVGQSVEDAFTKLGYSAGALKAVDYYENLTPPIPVETTFGKYNEKAHRRLLTDHGVNCMCSVLPQENPAPPWVTWCDPSCTKFCIRCLEDLTEGHQCKYYVNRSGRSKMFIDFDKGLGRFLKFNHLLECRCNPHPAPASFKIMTRVNYRLYRFDPDTRRFVMVLWFDDTNATVDEEARLVEIRHSNGSVSTVSFVDLGVESSDPYCLDRILSGQDYHSQRY
jgi:hypothetical protein